MAAVSLFWDTNMAAVTSCENTPYVLHVSDSSEKENRGLEPTETEENIQE